MFISLLEKIGAGVLGLLADFGRVVLLYGETMRQMTKKIRIRHIVAQMAHLGVDSVSIVSLTLLFTGVVLTLQTATEFLRFGAASAVGGVISVAIGRELGPVLVGVVCAGRIGSAITAEISTMKVTEQIDALKVMAVNPVNYLIVPRMLACMIVVPFLTLFGDLVGVFGGWIVAVYYNGISSYLYMDSINTFFRLYDLGGGMVKAIFFGNVIAVLGCYYGLYSPDGAEGVGIATTRTVVSSIIAIFALNALLTFIIF